VVADVARVVIQSDTALHQSHPVDYWNDTIQSWQIGMDQRIFVCSSSSWSSSSSDGDGSDYQTVAFLENDSETKVLVRIPTVLWQHVRGRIPASSNGHDNDDIDDIDYNDLVDGRPEKDVPRVFNMTALSVIVLIDGIRRCDSAVIDPKYTQWERQVVVEPENITLEWSYFEEPIEASLSSSSAVGDSKNNCNNNNKAVRSTRPIEQTALHVEALTMTSDYSWYETDFVLDVPATHHCTLSIVTRRQMALSAWMDGTIFMGSVVDHSTGMEVNVTLTIDYDYDNDGVGGLLAAGSHTLTILSESLGYLAYPGASTQGKAKGITGDVVLVTFHYEPTTTPNNNNKNNKNHTILYNITQNLVDGREWRSYPSLQGEAEENLWRTMRSKKDPAAVQSTLQTKRLLTRLDPKTLSLSSSSSSLSSPLVSPTWLVASFRTPTYDSTQQALFLEITRGRGHLWLNGKDLGRYWNITRGGGAGDGDGDDMPRRHSQQYYFLPHDFLYQNAVTVNEIVLFDATMMGWTENTYHDTNDDSSSSAVKNSNTSTTSTPRLVLSWIEQSNTSTLLDEVDFPSACLL
jgi:hypothetical protein